MFLHEGNPGSTFHTVCDNYQTSKASPLGPPSPAGCSGKGFCLCRQSQTQGQPGEGRCPRLSRDFATDREAQAVLS